LVEAGEVLNLPIGLTIEANKLSKMANEIEFTIISQSQAEHRAQ
jgi:hypothetical protein